MTRPASWLTALGLALALAAGCTPAQVADDADGPDGQAVPERSSPDTSTPSEPGPDTPLDDRSELPVGPAPPEPVPASRPALVAWLDQLVAAAVDAAGPGLVVLVTDEHGRELVSHQADVPVLPASTMKTVTSAAVLSTLGPDARLTTVVDATAPVGADGVLDGDLVLVGAGDPALATDTYGRWIYPARPRTPFDELADALVDAGVTHVTGDVVGVAGPFVGDGRAEGWLDRYFSDLDARYIAGLTVDGGLVTLVRYPELEAALDEVVDTDDDGVRSLPLNRLDLAELDLTDLDLEGLGLDELDLDRLASEEADPDAPPLEGGPFLDVDELRPHELAPLLGLDGPGPPEVRVRLADDPAAHAASELVRLLDEREVVVDGEARAGEPSQPIVGRLAQVRSPPIEELLRFAMKHSDNHLSDQLFHVIGRVRTGEGSWERGERALRQVLSHLGVDHEGARFADGSGLSRDGRLTARLLVDVDRVMTDARHGEVWASLMAVMGEDGTLRQRLAGTPAQGRFLGKTGTLRDVTALAGAVVGDDGGRYHLAVIANDEGEGRWVARLLMDELVLALVADLESCELVPAPGADDGPLGRPPSVAAC